MVIVGGGGLLLAWPWAHAAVGRLSRGTTRQLVPQLKLLIGFMQCASAIPSVYGVPALDVQLR